MSGRPIHSELIRVFDEFTVAARGKRPKWDGEVQAKPTRDDARARWKIDFEDRWRLEVSKVALIRTKIWAA